MHITVNSEMENRIDDNSSTEARQARLPDLSSMPCEETVMTQIAGIKKKAGHQYDEPACLGWQNLFWFQRNRAIYNFSADPLHSRPRP
jgi:hypothetical protein